MSFTTINDFNFINKLHIDLIKNPKGPSAFVEEDEYHILCLRLLKLGEMNLKEMSCSFIFHKQRCYVVNHGSEIKDLGEKPKEFYKELRASLDSMFSLLFGFSERVDEMEESLYDRSFSKGFMDSWFQIKKDILKIEKFLFRSRLYLEEFMKANKSYIDPIETELEHIVHKMTVNIRSASWYLNKMDVMGTFHDSIKNDRLNNNIYVLAIISGVFLPLNLIVGFFGMNTEGMFFKNHPTGTFEVLLLLIIVFLVLIFGIPVARILDRWILSHIFGRTDIYQSIQSKLNDFSGDANIK